MKKPFLASLCLAPLVTQASLTIEFNYDFDTGGFFTAERRAVLESAAQALTPWLNDSLLAITPGGVNSWTAFFFDPSTGGNTSLSGPAIPANTLRIYAGAHDLGGSTLGIGGFGGFSASGTSSFLNTLSTRGQSGVSSSTDVAMWGGSIAFDSDSPWSFDGTPGGSEIDFYSVALHELGHVFGLGTSASWANRVSGGNFTGPQVSTVAGGSVPVNAGADHWASGQMSVVPQTGASQEASMTPSISSGVRREFTLLDWAGMSDIGWQVDASRFTVVPEPVGLTLAAGGLVAFAIWRRRR
jgi:hypothetical protein